MFDVILFVMSLIYIGIHTKAMAANPLIRPKVEYSSAVWDPYTKENIYKIERVQRRAARYVYNNYDYSSSVTTMLENFLLSMPWA
jgi:hypothetical protein